MKYWCLAVLLVPFLSDDANCRMDANRLPVLAPGEKVKGEVGASESRRYRFHVPADGQMIVLELSGSPVDLDLYLYRGTGEDAELVDLSSGDTSREMIVLSRWWEDGLEPGDYEVEVECPLETLPGIRGRKVQTAPFQLSYELVRARVLGELRPGTPQRGETCRENGFVAVYKIDVPPGTEVLRIDVAEAHSDLDLFVRRGVVPMEKALADYEAASLVGRESLVIDQQADPPLKPGTYYVAVVDPAGHVDMPAAGFTLHATFGREPPPELLQIPQLQPGGTPLERAVFATVELVTPFGGGSGCLITPDGLILTNYHVIEGMDGAALADTEIIVSPTLDPRRAPVELFRAAVLHAEPKLDLALLRIVSGYYHQPLPEHYRFPFVPLGDPRQLRLADPLWMVGFPFSGGLRGRPSVTVTRGIVAGFEESAGGYFIKTDAKLSAGGSGGAALNQDGQLVGIPTLVIEEAALISGARNVFIAMLRPIDTIPESWLQEIRNRIRDR